jgi:hypothetical protein
VSLAVGQLRFERCATPRARARGLTRVLPYIRTTFVLPLCILDWRPAGDLGCRAFSARSLSLMGNCTVAHSTRRRDAGIPHWQLVLPATSIAVARFFPGQVRERRSLATKALGSSQHRPLYASYQIEEAPFDRVTQSLPPYSNPSARHCSSRRESFASSSSAIASANRSASRFASSHCPASIIWSVAAVVP